ncbi:MAG TPA: TetR family transcriptional regulator [Allosphingosinicella sp.]|jgi:AcrR family transcriptional regulator
MTTRIKNAAATRAALLQSARRRFLEESYNDVGLRDIARDAGVDVALVARYFGSKEDLFREVLRGTCPDWLDPEVTAEGLPSFLAKLVVQGAGEAEEPENANRLLIILRSSSSPAMAQLVSSSFEEDVLEPLARLLPGDDAKVRAAMAMSILMGIKVLRTVMSVEPLLVCKHVDLEAKVERLLRQALFG